MRLACPACQATYEIPDDKLTAGRRLRCARCAHEWAFVAPPLELAEAAAGPDGDTPSLAERAMPAGLEDAVRTGPTSPSARITAAARAGDAAADPARNGAPDMRVPLAPGARPEAVPRRGAGMAMVAIAWLLTFAILAGAGAACYVWRASVMAAWPPSQRVYAALGLR